MSSVNATRRSFGGFGAALLLASASIPAAVFAAEPGNPDADLIAACEQFQALEWKRLRLFFGPDQIEDDDERDALVTPIAAEQKTMVTAIQMACPTTLEGFRARARAAVLWAPDKLDEPFDTFDVFAHANLIDLVGEDWLDQVNVFMGRDEAEDTPQASA